MRKLVKFLKIFFRLRVTKISFIAILLLYFQMGFCNSLSIETKVDKKILKFNERINFTIIIKGNYKSSPKIKLPSFKGFKIIARSSEYNFNLRSQLDVSQIKLVFILKPTKIGKLIIGKIRVQYKKEIIESQPIQIEVLASSTPKKKIPSEESPLYKGEEIIL